jgi:hypothetical protein
MVLSLRRQVLIGGFAKNVIRGVKALIPKISAI